MKLKKNKPIFSRKELPLNDFINTNKDIIKDIKKLIPYFQVLVGTITTILGTITFPFPTLSIFVVAILPMKCLLYLNHLSIFT